MTSKNRSPKAMVHKTKLDKALKLVLDNLQHISLPNLYYLELCVKIEKTDRDANLKNGCPH